jgi:hypothetical protein
VVVAAEDWLVVVIGDGNQRIAAMSGCDAEIAISQRRVAPKSATRTRLWQALAFQAPPHDNRRVKLRHAAALALVGWTLVIDGPGKTAPKGCTICVASLEKTRLFSTGYKTKAECEKAGDDFTRDFYARVRKTGEVVVFPPGTPECH